MRWCCCWVWCVCVAAAAGGGGKVHPFAGGGHGTRVGPRPTAIPTYTDPPHISPRRQCGGRRIGRSPVPVLAAGPSPHGYRPNPPWTACCADGRRAGIRVSFCAGPLHNKRTRDVPRRRPDRARREALRAYHLHIAPNSPRGHRQQLSSLAAYVAAARLSIHDLPYILPSFPAPGSQIMCRQWALCRRRGWIRQESAPVATSCLWGA